jgi:AraC family transcriptional regulator, regulatory protein of adaptative response / methylated-DNA-[protein]-cysteine methyltransferase
MPMKARAISRTVKAAAKTPTCKPDKSVAIRFAVGQCSLGSVLIARTDRGICAILLGDDPKALVSDLRSRFPRAVLTYGNNDLERLLAKVESFIEAPGRGLDVALDTHGTAFQRRVWEALTRIPVGSTASYTEIARRIGAPSSVRAVARACGANAIAVAIPCHRVVRNDGNLSGYRWGVGRKRTLLEREGIRC